MVNNYLITGANSFIGKYLCDKLDKENEKYKGLDLKSKNSKIINLDIRDKNIDKFIEKDQIVIHLAAVSNDKRFDDNPKIAKEINEDASINLINICEKKKIKKFIFASSEWVYGDNNNENILQENYELDIKNLVSKYAISKLKIENYILENNFTFNTNMLRFGITYGKSQEKLGLLEKLNDHMLSNNFIELNSSFNARKYINVVDLVEAIYKISKTNLHGVYNVCGDELISLKEFVKVFEEVHKKKIKIIEKNPNDFIIRNLSNDKIKLHLNWSPKINIYEGIKSLQ